MDTLLSVCVWEVVTSRQPLSGRVRDNSARFLPPSPPAEKAPACEDQAGKASTRDGTGAATKPDCDRCRRIRAAPFRLPRGIKLRFVTLPRLLRCGRGIRPASCRKGCKRQPVRPRPPARSRTRRPARRQRSAQTSWLSSHTWRDH
jgi:hypothetical protein